MPGTKKPTIVLLERYYGRMAGAGHSTSTQLDASRLIQLVECRPAYRPPPGHNRLAAAGRGLHSIVFLSLVQGRRTISDIRIHNLIDIIPIVLLPSALLSNIKNAVPV